MEYYILESSLMNQDDFSGAILDFHWSFLKTNPASIPEIACVFIGGSRLYNPRPHNSPQNASRSDYDGIIVCRSKYDMYVLVSDIRRREVLLNLLGIEREESRFEIPPPASPLYAEYDGVRVTGYDGDNIKRSTKVVSLEAFFDGRTSLNILSSKDRRIYDNPGMDYARSVTKLSQSTTFDDFIISHGQMVYTARLENGTKLGAFGVISDLILTGVCVHGQGLYGQRIKRILVDHYVSKTGYHPSVDTFTRYPNFSPRYIEMLQNELAEIGSDTDTSADAFRKPSLQKDRDVYMFGDIIQTQVSTLLNKPLYNRKITREALAQFNEGRVIRHSGHNPQFSRNSASYTVTTRGPGDIVDMFVKSTPYAEDELRSAKMARRVFPRIFVPRLANSGELLYPLFRGITVSDGRLAYINGGRQDQKLLESILHVELVRSEDTLRAYRQSLTLQEQGVTPPRRNIQRFFHDRLVNDSRMHQHYGKGMTIAGQTFTLDQLLNLRWRVNDRPFPSLREAFDEARRVTAPDSAKILSCPLVFGLGDAHGGNVMFNPSNEKGGPSDALFIDFEVGDWHPVMLDLAKQLYADVFFETYYRHLIIGNTNNGLKYKISKHTNTIVVELNPQVDSLSQALLDAKLHYLLKPLIDLVRELGVELEEYVPVLTTALFLCATVASSFANHEESFVINFATGLILSRAQNWTDFVLQFEELGLKA
ncbi:hypothetical protein F5Y10DRAFT_287424 [Nemania abortiva]|nr:hypothetical protein F5Y10DRAFT_287424 [Nemania abortiva]